MKLNNLGYLLKEGFRGIFLHGFMSFAAVCVTVACLVIVGSFSALAYNLDEMVQELNQTSEILVYIDADLSDAEARSIGTKINLLDNVLQATFVSREEALKDFIADHDGDSAFSGVQASDLRHRYVVTLEDNTKMKETDAQLKQLPGVAKTNAAYELAEGFTTIQNVLHMVSAAVIAVLLIVSLLIISNTVKLAMYDRKDEIAIMKMVGATNGFIRLPFVVEGFTLGMMGAILAFGLEWVGYDALIQKIAAVDALQLFNFVPFQELLIPMVIVFAAAGMFVGIVGSWTSIRKFMNV
ncbi:MAG: permease-like cell division protein FtsX [Candidatus Faecousia sp.]|nr:permease-like cell division protein FtsX [Clostridiales bacterium]MCI6937414.1 permease-like cell division protein FtsX [Clostridiales bacterium]MDD5883494.1 permease-like cell division protein FtsX [Bacillota bacterium]MDY4599865.1 permease-like cell division protein FtsX [Candidatus Faecousia sp.]